MSIVRRLLGPVRERSRRAAGHAVHRGWRWLRDAGAVSNRNPGPYRFGELGDGTTLAFPLGTVFNERWITIGPFSIIGEQVTLSAGFLPGLDLGPEPIVRIGGGCVIGRGSHIVGHQRIELGDDVWTGPDVYITDQAHEYRDTEVPIGKQWPRNEPVSIGSKLLDRHRRRHPPRRPDRPQRRRRRQLRRRRMRSPTTPSWPAAPARQVRTWNPEDGWQPPIRHDPPRPVPDGLTAAQLRALVGWDLRLPGETPADSSPPPPAP